VEDPHNVEPLPTEFLVGVEGRADVPGADQGDLPSAIQPQDQPDFLPEPGDAVAQPALPEIPEVGEVLPNLGGGDPALVGEALRRDGAVAFNFQLFQHAVIAGEPADGRDRDARVQLLLLVFLRLLDARDVAALLAWLEVDQATALCVP